MKRQKGSAQALEDLRGRDPLARFFCDFISFDTTAVPGERNAPSSPGQLRLGAHIAAMTDAMGFASIQEANGVVYVGVPASPGREASPPLALITHLDTSPDAPGGPVNAALVEDYQGGEVDLGHGQVLEPALCPELAGHAGDDIIVTDGATLLGADDKAGAAAVCCVLDDIRRGDLQDHGPLCAVFTTDEELGLSAARVDLAKVGCAYGVTVDGCEAGDLDVATFEAAGAVVTFKGRSVHTGHAYGVMRNALMSAAEFVRALPPQELPQTTRGGEGFYHVHNLEGDVACASLQMIVRDFDKDGLRRRLDFIRNLAASINGREGFECVSLRTFSQYGNMAKALEEKPQILRLCRKAYRDAGIEVRENRVRGGTDGSVLSERGLPCPNIFTGALCCHSLTECLPVTALRQCREVLRCLIAAAAAPEDNAAP